LKPWWPCIANETPTTSMNETQSGGKPAATSFVRNDCAHAAFIV
jgi:hypothetical protein